ncbi:MAG TPA: nuclear transport factor 2 family protein [Abditibacteriaceae bacterium]|nr:nuclear transport factor 2 family protein [Abditibacteriaceae bacterium]
MSEQENVQVVQAIYAAFGQGDIPAVLDALTDDIDWWIDGPPEIPYAGTQHGRAEVSQNFVRLNETVAFESFAPEEFIAQGDQVVAIGSDQRRVRKTGKLIENKWAMVFTLREGKVSRFRAFESSAAAVAAIRGG